MREVFASEIRQDRFDPKLLSAVDLHLDRPADFARVASEIARNHEGRLDVLINNAGYGLFGALEDFSEEQLRRQMEVNFFGPMLLARALLPLLRSARGRVINLSSIAGRVSFPYYGAYSASKFAIEGFTEGLHYELERQGVRVTLVEPGGFRTDFASTSYEVADGAKKGVSVYAGETNALIRAFGKFSARLADPEKVVSVIVNLVEGSRVPLRALVGADARFMALLKWLLPERLRLLVLAWVYRLAVFNR